MQRDVERERSEPPAPGSSFGDVLADHLWSAVIVTDAGGRVVRWNRRAEEMYGWRAEEVLGRPIVELTVHPDDDAMAAEIMASVAAGEPWEGTFRVQRRDGSTFMAHVRDVPLLDAEGRLTGVLGISIALGEPPLASTETAVETQRARELGTDLLPRLHAITTILFGAVTVDEVSSTILGHVLTELGAGSGMLWLADREAQMLRAVGHVGIEAGVPDRYAALPLDAAVPAAEVLRTGRPVFTRDAGERDRGWPAIAGTATSMTGMAVLPLKLDGEALGSLAVGFPTEREFDERHRTFLVAVAHQCSIALDRARLHDAERHARQRVEFLGEVTTALSSTLDPWEVFDRLTKVVVPHLADWCSVQIPRPDGHLHRIAVHHAEHPETAQQLVGSFAVPVDGDAPVAVAFRTGETVVVPEVTEEMIRSYLPDPEVLEIARILEVRSGVAVPLVSREQVHGVMTFAFSTSGRTYTPAETEVLRDVVGRAATALERALLYDRERRLAASLQEVVRPNRLPELPEHDLCGRYVAASDLGAVGGDFWEALVLPDQRLVLALGDVAGHGEAVAAAMGRLRNSLRAYAIDDPGPAEVLAHVDRAARLDDGMAFATLAYVLYDLGSGELRWATAGHPPPMVAGPHGCRWLEEPRNIVLGVTEGAYREGSARLHPGEVLVLYSDGLIEDGRRPLDEGLERLAAELRSRADGDLDVLCDGLLGALVAGHPEDDVSVIAMRRR